jgi:hypothetical protein
MRALLNAISNSPHAEERPTGASRSTHDAFAAVTRDLSRMVGVPTPFIDSVLGLVRLKASSLGLLDKAA